MTTSPLQGRDELTISAPASQIWALIDNPALLSAWVPMVRHVDAPAGRREHIGATRTCQVRMMGRRGQVTERCTEMVPQRWFYYVVDAETLGFARLVAGFGFSIGLRPIAAGTTSVSLASYYQPRGLLGHVANTLILASQLRRSRRTMLSHLKRLAEKSPALEPSDVSGKVVAPDPPRRGPGQGGVR